MKTGFLGDPLAADDGLRQRLLRIGNPMDERAHGAHGDLSRKATGVADGGFVQRVGTQKPVAEGRGATQDAAVGGVFWSLPHRGRRARSLPSAAQGEQGSPPPRRRNPGGSGAGAQATCADQSTGNAPNARCAWLSNHHKEASFSNPKVNSCGKDFMRATHASPAR